MWVSVGQDNRQFDWGFVSQLKLKTERKLALVGDCRAWLLVVLFEFFNLLADSSWRNVRKENGQGHEARFSRTVALDDE